MGCYTRLLPRQDHARRDGHRRRRPRGATYECEPLAGL